MNSTVAEKYWSNCNSLHSFIQTKLFTLDYKTRFQDSRENEEASKLQFNIHKDDMYTTVQMNITHEHACLGRSFM